MIWINWMEMPLEMINKFTSVVCSKSVSAAAKWPDNSTDAVKYDLF